MTDGSADTPGPAPRARHRGLLWFLVVAVVLAVVGGAAGAGLWHLSSSPALCNSCHIMKPYVQAWRASPHQEVTCVRCHYPPGLRDTLWVKYQALTQVVKWATKTYSSKPFAEVEDGSCLRSGCHGRPQLDKTTVSKRGIVFDHRPHLEGPRQNGQRRGPGLRCTSCHSQIVVETHIEVRQSTCFLCHFKGMKGGRELHAVGTCTACHQAPKGDIRIGAIPADQPAGARSAGALLDTGARVAQGVTFNHEEVTRRGVACQSCHLNVVEGDGAAPRERCATCHNQADKLGRYPDTPLIHDAHVTRHNLECGRCHTEIKHRLPPRIGAPTAAASPPGPIGRLALGRP